MASRIVHLVLCEGPLGLLGGYWSPVLAQTHARVVTGASVIAVAILDELPEAVIDMVQEDFEGEETPVENEIPEVLMPSPKRHR